MKRRISYDLRFSETELKRGGLILMEQAFKEMRTRIEEERFKHDLQPFGDLVVTVRVEQWCREAT